jgi:integrase
MKITGIKKARNSKGTIYYYDRLSGKRLYAEYGSNEFLAELAASRANVSHRSKSDVKTFGDLRSAFIADDEFQDLADVTRAEYHAIFQYLKPMDLVPIKAFDAPFVSDIKRRAKKARSWSHANRVVGLISRVFNWGMEPGYTKTNPTDGVKKYRRPKGQKRINRRWHDYELDLVLYRAEPHLQTAIAIGAYTGLREGDTVALPLSAITDAIRTKQSKTGKQIVLPIHEKLKPYLEEALDREGRQALTLVIGKRGRTLTKAGFKAMFFRLIRKLEAEKLIQSGLTFHGLRHTVGTHLAEAGASDATIQAMLGHETPSQAQTYRRDADQVKGAEIAIDLLQKRTKNE